MIKPQSAPALVPIRDRLRGLGPANLAVVRGWLTEPLVTRWWPNPEGALRTITRHLSKPALERLIRTVGGPDVGYLQLYDPHHAPPLAADEQTTGHPYRAPAGGTRGIDLFNGEVRVIGRYGSRLIRCVVEYLFNGDTPCVVTDPDPTNARSVAAFRRAGLRCIGQRVSAWWHLRLRRCDNLQPTVSP